MVAVRFATDQTQPTTLDRERVHTACGDVPPAGGKWSQASWRRSPFHHATRGRRQLDLLDRSPPTVAVDGLGLVEAVDRLGDCVVVAVPGLPTELTASASASR